MEMMKAKTPAWLEAQSIPAHLLKRLTAAFTPTARGWVRWYKGATRWVCGKGTDPEAVHAAWDVRRKEIDSGEAVAAVRARASHTVRTAAGEFYLWIDRRVETGEPKPMRPATRSDYLRYITAFGRAVGADRLLVDIDPTDFTAYAKTFAGHAPSDLARAVAYVTAFFRWCVAEGLMSTVPKFGTYFRKPPKQAHRDKRIQQTKAYTPLEIRSLWEKANATERLWIGLGLNGALDNADLSEFTADVIDGDKLDYRRRKVGLARRIIPLRPEVLELLEKYKRPQAGRCSRLEPVLYHPGRPPPATGEAEHATAGAVQPHRRRCSGLATSHGQSRVAPQAERNPLERKGCHTPPPHQVQRRGGSTGLSFAAHHVR